MRRWREWRRSEIRALVALWVTLTICLWPLPARSQTSGLLTVIIDPGHGGQDLGASGSSGAPAEKDLALTFARKLAEVMEVLRIARPILTRKDDYAISLDERAGVANHRGGDLLISLHMGNAFRPSPLGFTLYYWSPASSQPAVPAMTAEASTSWDLGQLHYWERSRRVAEVINVQLLQALPWLSGGVLPADLHLLRRVQMPAVLLELGCLIYPPESTELQKSEFQEAVAKAVAEAIREWSTVNSEQ